MRKILVLVSLLLLIGCAAGKQLEKDSLLQVRENKTTCRKVVTVFGTPTRMINEARENKQKKLIYEYRETDPDFITYIPLLDLLGGYTLTIETTTFVFNENDVVEKITSDKTKKWYHSSARGGPLVVEVNSEDLSGQQICQEEV